MSRMHVLPPPSEPSARIDNTPAANISYFTPAQQPRSGTASEPQPSYGNGNTKLFKPITLRGMTLQNRIMLSPLCQYSSENGHFSDWHMAHLGGIISRGPGFSMIEATAVTPEGRITPQDSGLWQDSQIEPLRRVVEFAHSQGQKIGIQIAHAGRKASTNAPWLSKGRALAPKELGGWADKVYAPSPIAWNEHHAVPIEMTKKDIEDLKVAWVATVKRALKAGFDAIEIHNAHGYLLHSFLSPVSNKRTDEYGGDFDGRTRLTREIVSLTRHAIPDDMPLFLRISATDWLEADKELKGWEVADSVRLAPILADLGVDLIDVSSGGNHHTQHVKSGPGYQAPAAGEIKKAVGDRCAVATVGKITSGKQANELLESLNLDIAVAGSAFIKNPGLVWAWAEELNVEINIANQIRWAFGGRVGAEKK